MNARVKTNLLCLAVLAAGALALARVGESAVDAAPSSTNDSLSRAFEAILGIEAVVNVRDDNGEYISQSEGAESLADRLDPVLADSLVGVTGLGHLSDVLGYQPTGFTELDYATSIIVFRQLFILADLTNGGDGTAKWVHTLYSGAVSGSVAQLVLNFEALGSFTDDDGNRVPVEIPNALLGLPGEGSVAATGRCVCLCERNDGVWQLTSFYFVLSPREMLFDVG